MSQKAKSNTLVTLVAGIPLLGAIIYGITSGDLSTGFGIILIIAALIALSVSFFSRSGGLSSHPLLHDLITKEDLSTDDLVRARESVRSQGLTGTPLGRFIGGFAKLRLMAQSLAGTSSQTAISTAEVSYLADKMDKRLDVQQEEVEKVTTRVESITVTMHQVSVNAGSVTELATQAKEYSFTGRDELQEAIDQMKDISSRTDHTLSLINELNEKSTHIQDVTKVIE